MKIKIKNIVIDKGREVCEEANVIDQDDSKKFNLITMQIYNEK